MTAWSGKTTPTPDREARSEDIDSRRQELLTKIDKSLKLARPQLIAEAEPMNERQRLAEIEVLSHCRHLNFHAIASLLEGYGFDDPENTIGRLKELDTTVRDMENTKSVTI